MLLTGKIVRAVFNKRAIKNRKDIIRTVFVDPPSRAPQDGLAVRIVSREELEKEFE